MSACRTEARNVVTVILGLVGSTVAFAVGRTQVLTELESSFSNQFALDSASLVTVACFQFVDSPLTGAVM